jgi:hypothetical protein
MLKNEKNKKNKKKKQKNKKKTKKKKKKTAQRFTVDLHSETLTSFSLLSINKLN